MFQISSFNGGTKIKYILLQRICIEYIQLLLNNPLLMIFSFDITQLSSLFESILMGYVYISSEVLELKKNREKKF